MTPITDEIWNEMHFMEHLYNKVCEFIDSMILCSAKPVTEDDINWIVDCISDSMHLDSISEQCALYHALRTKYTPAMYGYSIQQVIIDEPCTLEDYKLADDMFLPDNRETRRHGYNYAKETRYKKPNRRRPWE